MEWLNYHHLLYFWTVVRAGSIQKASEELRISAPAISAQLKLLEEQLGEKLFARTGRRLELTEMGRTVFSYAEDIFTLGREMLDVVRNRPIGRPLRLDVGIVDVMPKVVVQKLLEPALHLQETVRIVCREANSDQLLARLATHELDVVLSDSPVDPAIRIRAYSHLLGECGILFVASANLAGRYRRRFPQSLDGAPMFLPTDNTALRRNLEFWFEKKRIRPLVLGEFEDYALLRAFGETGAGIFPLPSVIEFPGPQRGMGRIGLTNEVRTQFYAISAERKLQHPAVIAIRNAARKELFK
ncbi:MAG TPA: transcriptional activator NhaR [Candidatus Angelobacter sp.]|nr:transcriptional activator NhaR [Candidatus Angelobacter sp.]